MHHPTSPLKVIQSYSRKTPLDSSTFYRCLLHHFRIFYESFERDNQTQKSLELLPTSPFADRKSTMLLHWLCRNHDDCRHVTIDEERWASSESTIVATEPLDGMGQVGDIPTEDASRSGFATEDLDTAEYEGDLEINI